MDFCNWVLIKCFLMSIVFSFCFSPSSALSFSKFPSLDSTIGYSAAVHQDFTALSEFRLLNRRVLRQCINLNPYLQIKVSSNSSLSDEEFVTVTVSGVVSPSDTDWVAMITPTSDTGGCPLNEALYAQTGDISKLPLLCHYPIKAQYLSSDPGYLSRKKQECKATTSSGQCVTTYSGSLTFHVINIRTDIEFVFFTDGFQAPCILASSKPLSFRNPNQPLYGHLSSIDSTATSMRLTWVSGDKQPQLVKYGDGLNSTSVVSTFTQNDMCNSMIPSPAKDFGWHDPGYIHSAVMTGLKPSTKYPYTYGSDSVGWNEVVYFRTPPAGGTDVGSDVVLKFLAIADMGKTPHDASIEHYIQPGAASVVEAMIDEMNSSNFDSIFHIGDISYATGFLVEWDYFLKLINPLASRVSYMTGIGNHERDYPNSGSVYVTPDSGGECGVPYETYFQMPNPAKDKPWYSIEQGSVHFTMISTEHDWSESSEQYKWMKNDMQSVNRTKTPWLIFMGHRPFYSTIRGTFGTAVHKDFVKAVEPLLFQNKVNVALLGHVHNYERTCAVYQKQCQAMPTQEEDGYDTYDHTNYTAPVHAVIGMAGFSLDKFPDQAEGWSLKRISEFGYLRAQATRQELKFEFVNASTKDVRDKFRITRTESS